MIPITQPRFSSANSASEGPGTMALVRRVGGVRSVVPASTLPSPRCRKRPKTASQILAMLSLLPIQATSVPRVHVGTTSARRDVENP